MHSTLTQPSASRGTLNRAADTLASTPDRGTDVRAAETVPEMPPPLLSVGLAVRNGEPYLRQMIDSILAQTFQDFELIISDNCSTDNTPAVCAEYAARDRRVRYLPLTANIGAVPNHNRTVQLARGRFFKYCAHDDIMAPTFLEKCLAALEQAPDAVVAYPRTMFIDANGASIREDTICLASAPGPAHERLDVFFQRISFINPLYGVIRTDVLRRTHLERSFLKSDQVLIAELLMHGRFVEVPEILFYRRLHDGRSMQANPTKASLRRFYDPRNRTEGFTLPVKLRLTLEYLRSSTMMPPRWRDRPRCLAVTLRDHTLPTLLELADVAMRGPKKGRNRLQTAR